MMVLMSLPDTYTTHLETLADSATSASQTFTVANLISKAIETVRQMPNQSRLGPQARGQGCAFQILRREQAQQRKGKPPNKWVECFNCHKLGHIQCECWALAEERGSDPTSKKDKGKNRDNLDNTANVTHNGVWSAVITLPPTSSNGAPHHSECHPTHTQVPTSRSAEEPTASTYTADAITNPPETHVRTCTLRATRHMTPHKNLLSNYISIAPKPIMPPTPNSPSGIKCGSGPIPSLTMDGHRTLVSPWCP